jgi:signal transduction histidine kinase
MERLFKPFHRGQTSADGVGLGLAIVKNAVTLHSGSIEVGRSLLGGARFSLRVA